MKRKSKVSMSLIYLVIACIVITFAIQILRGKLAEHPSNFLMGAAPSFFYTLGMLLICFALVNKHTRQSCFCVFLGSLIYEFSQLTESSGRTFDFLDVIAIFLAYALFVFWELRLYRRGPNVAT